ncbi:MAG: VOC family protein [Propionibacteriaceae bacterium]|nr:VOC family protein [Propionibacteriaceae bacterium]
MLADYGCVPTIAVKDLQRARDFYEGLLGFTQQGDSPDGVVYAAGSTSFLVYPSAFAGTNKATAMGFQVPSGSFDSEVGALRDKGISFQTFEMEGLTWNDGVASFGEEYRAVWFEDPDGNILNVETDSDAG